MLVSVTLLSACSGLGSKKEVNEFAGWSVDKIYTNARDEMTNKDYKRASQLLEATIAQYPFSAQSIQAQLELPYVFWKDDERTKALAAADRFIALNGSHPKVDYVYYLKGLINFNQNVSYLATLTGEQLNDRDPKAAKDSFEAFKTLVEKFPNSRYAKDSRERMRYLVNTMAKHETGVAQYYLERKAYVAAINRAQEVLRNYDGTPATEDALIIMVKAYEGLNLQDLRNDTFSVLKKNYPNTTMSLKPTSKSWLEMLGMRSDRKKALVEVPAPQ
ncbi:Beta-barrel assembly machine subunit BamD [Hydromonas duriensis]|uniref:Outer membrane protein assembly factor BamD n=1 Tax=Hydromonas duriensis TaxID=1527608 RepID=A0A4R6Y1K3_9BURK|nr:Beta-barrel assembly machine subunit BamD [Hydromonas duriensis]